MTLFQHGKKKEGNIADMLVSAFLLFMFLAFFAITVHYIKIISIKQNVDSLTREYILIEEQQGKLENDEFQDLKDSLTDMGFSKYTISCNGFAYSCGGSEAGSNYGTANYGENVNVDIVIHSSAHELQISNLFGIFDDGITIESHQESISKR